jgi:hypothetical protein
MVEYILILMMFGSSPAVSFQEFKSKQTCEDAVRILESQNYLKPCKIVCTKK